MSITPFAPPVASPVVPQLCLARQAIFDTNGRVFGYELLYRATADANYANEGGDHAAASVLATATGAVGLDVLTGRKRAFINVTRNVLLSGASLLPPKAVVIELLESVQVDRDVIETCRSLKQSGYAIALDDFVGGSDAEALLPYASFVKVDVLSTTPAERAALAARLAPRGLKLLAEKVESADIAAASKAEGYGYFQGYFFLRPTTHVARRVPESQVTYLRLLYALSRPDLSVNDLENLVKSDVSLSYRVLRTINSSAFALRREVTSIRQALILLGQDQVRKWAAVWVLAGLNTGGVPETLSVALIRARACELMGQSDSTGAASSELFLLGLCSVLDAIVGCPMSELVERLSLGQSIADALLERPSPVRPVLDAAIAYERGNWDEAERLAVAAGLLPSAPAEAYASAVAWTEELQKAA